MRPKDEKRSFIGKRIEMLILVENLHRAAALAKKLGFAPSGLSSILTGKTKQPGDKFWRAIREHYPAWERYLRGEEPRPPKTPYEQQDPKPLNQPDSDRGSYGLPDLSGHQLTEVEHPENEWYVAALKEIMTKGDPGLRSTVQMVIRECFEKLRREGHLSDKIAHLEEELRVLKKALASYVDQNPGAKEA